jgi:iron-sulfur cluster insertion protein
MAESAETRPQAPALIRVTAAAAAQVRSVLAAHSTPDAAVRVFIAGRGETGFQYGLAMADGPDPDDILVEHDGVRIVVDLVSAPLLSGAQLDFVERDGRRGFAILNAGSGGNCAGGGCSCGRGGCGRR